MRPRFVPLLLALALACKGDSPAAPSVSLAGHWVGAIGSQTIDLTMTESAGTVAGSGTISNTPTGTRALTVAGSYTGGPIGHVDVTLSSGPAQPFALSGQVYATSILGSLNGSGFTGDVVTFTRH
jgi:hypothetical protein